MAEIGPFQDPTPFALLPFRAQLFVVIHYENPITGTCGNQRNAVRVEPSISFVENEAISDGLGAVDRIGGRSFLVYKDDQLIEDVARFSDPGQRFLWEFMSENYAGDAHDTIC